jgi:hypothetical protein
VRWYLAHARAGSVDEALLQEAFVADLGDLHSLLTEAGLIESVWVVGGLLLAWAREGKPLRHDLRDADFSIRREDFDRLERALPLLADNGFIEHDRYIGNNGLVNEIKLHRNWTTIDFFLVDERDGSFFLHSYGIDDRPTEFLERVPAQPLVPFEFLGKTWLKVQDHDLELSAVYGDWRVPDPHFSFMRQSPCIAERRPWERRNEFVAATRARRRRS